MKPLVFFSLLALTVSASLSAQQTSFLNSAASDRPSFLRAENTPLLPALALPPAPIRSAALSDAAMPSAALPDAPAPPPVGGDFGNRWDLAAGYEYVHFSSAPFSANLSGLHTSLAYSLNDWFAFEGSVVAAFGGDVFAPGETAKYVLLTGGGRIYWNRDPKRWSPWAHALVGGAHVNPQVAGSSKNGFAFQAGGGVDYYFNPRLSFRGEGDYVLTRLYSGNQNNFQIGAGFVLHF
jgi:Outer membrane protein beta-barrel domain